jgi:hypothetical protein
MSAASGPGGPSPRRARIRVKGLKINTLLSPEALPADLVPPEPAPAGDPILELELEGGSLIVAARLNGKSYRRALKAIAEQGAANLLVTLQGNLKPPAVAGGPFLLDAAGLAVVVKAPKEPPA